MYYPLTYFWILIAIITFFLLQKVIAPFGRHTSNNWGPTINARWAWFIMEIPSPIVLNLSFYFHVHGDIYTDHLFLLGLWNLHYFNRSVIYPLRQKDVKKTMPVFTMSSAIFFNLINGFLNGSFLSWTATSISHYPTLFYIGLGLFLLGAFINIWHDNILLGLRKKGDSTYYIPQKGMFSFISCPNLLGEIIEWIGFMLMAYNLAALSFAIWTFANLAPRAIAHHKWYQQKFPDYPKNRKALIPFIW